MLLVQPNPELQVYIRKTFNEDLSTRHQDLEAIKDWLKKEPHLPDTWDEVRIMNFLRGCNFSLEKCKRKLDMYFTMRTALPEFFSNRDVLQPELQEVIKISRTAVLPGLTPDGKRVILVGSSPVDEFAIPATADFLKLALMVGDIRLGEERFGVAGDVYVFDAATAVNRRLLQFPPAVMKKFFVCVQKAYPVKIKEVHVINVTPLVDLLVAAMKPLLKEKLRERIRIHQNLESLYEYVPREVLPEEYGGTAGKLGDFRAKWLKTMEEYRPWFKEQENIKADESKRLGKPATYEDLFGLEGSFRKLTVD